MLGKYNIFSCFSVCQKQSAQLIKNIINTFSILLLYNNCFEKCKQRTMIPVYRYHAVQSNGWRFTFSTNPNLGYGWILDGIAFQVPDDANPNAVPLHTFHYDQSATYGGWRNNFSRTMTPASQGWTYDGVAFKVFPHQVNGTVPIYQYYCIQSDGWRFHFSSGEKPGQEGWTHDGIAFYAYPGVVQ